MEVVLSAYADDVMFTDPVDLRSMRECQQVFSAASSAKINWGKCSGLLVGGQSGAGLYSYPGGGSPTQDPAEVRLLGLPS